MTGGRVAIVTGGARGLGRGAADRLLADGARVVVFDVAAAADLPLRGVGDLDAHAGLQGLHVDVRDESALRAAVSGVVAVLGRLDVVVAAAGVAAPPTPLAAADPGAIDRVLEVNVRGVVATLRAVLPPLVAAGAGSVVVVSSQTGSVPWAEWAVYSASKAFVTALAHAAALEHARDGVRVNVLAPGTIDTDMARSAFGHRAHRSGRSAAVEMERYARDRIPVGRLGTPADVGAAVAWLVSEDAAFVTGATLNLSGGELVTV